MNDVTTPAPLEVENQLIAGVHRYFIPQQGTQMGFLHWAKGLYLLGSGL